MVEDLKLLLSNIIPETLQKSQIIIKEKEKSNGCMFFLFSGKLGVYKNGIDKQHFIGYLEPGSFFGEISLILNRDRDATVIVESETAKIGIINYKIFFEIINKKPQFMLIFLKISIQRLLNIQNRLDQLMMGRNIQNLFQKDTLLSNNFSDLKINIFDYVHQIPIRTCRKNEILFEEKDLCDGNMYFIIEGEVSLYRIINNKENIIRILTAGDFFGEMALLMKSQSRAASAKISSPVAKLVSINEKIFNKIGDINPEFYFIILKTIYLRLIDIEKRISYIEENKI